jgi:hypothetical protein
MADGLRTERGRNGLHLGGTVGEQIPEPLGLFGDLPE